MPAFNLTRLSVNVITDESDCDSVTWFAHWNGSTLMYAQPSIERQEEIASLLETLRSKVFRTGE
jgi:hypothetical protein